MFAIITTAWFWTFFTCLALLLMVWARDAQACARWTWRALFGSVVASALWALVIWGAQLFPIR